MTVAAPALPRWRLPGPWTAVVLATAVLTLAVPVLDLRLDPTVVARLNGGYGTPSALVGAVLVGCAAIVRVRRGPHLIAAVLAGFGLLWAVDAVCASWAQLGVGQSLPGTAVAFWFVDRVGAFLLLGLPLLLLTYPAGRLPRGRLRPVSVLVLAAAAALPVALLVMPHEVLSRGEPLAGVPVFDPLRLPVPLPVGLVVLRVAQLLTFAAPLGAVVVTVLGYRRASAADRTRLRWLLWAGIVDVLLVAISLLFPLTPVTSTALYLAVVLTAVSVTLGLVAPERFDIDTLVGGTVVYAGVAAAVIALDLALVTVGGALLGPRLSERNVTLVVLLLAVVVYAPLRAWLWSLVRRVLVGRRGERYDVVTSLAARLEQTPDVADQLPALAASVAEAFKVGFVQVEVLRANGETLVATSGRRPSTTTEQPITYRGEPVGRLVLPGEGLRSLLSARDRRLLLDVVRQAAVAVRNATLARDLQQSREQLVLAREDDRRRIRNDLHDGLGPALSGVAMRLEAAEQTVAADPDRARILVSQARTDLTTALADVRRLVHGLRPPALDDLGLVAAVDHQAEALRSAGTTVEVDADGLGRLPAAVEVAAFRVVAEALTNVSRHAGARHCVVSLVDAGDELAVTVTDDGRGIPDAAVAGVGLLSIRERAAELGGRVEIGDGPAGGTRVALRLPLARAAS